LGAISRLEISFDVQLSIRRLKRYGWEWKRDWEYAVLVLVSLTFEVKEYSDLVRIELRNSGRRRRSTGSVHGIGAV